jgi:hypothetical protein
MMKRITSGKIGHFKHDHHLELTSRAWFHMYYINLCIGVMQVEACKASEDLCPSPARRRSLVRQSIREGLVRACFNMLRIISKDIISPKTLQRTIPLNVYGTWKSLVELTGAGGPKACAWGWGTSTGLA